MRGRAKIVISGASRIIWYGPFLVRAAGDVVACVVGRKKLK